MSDRNGVDMSGADLHGANLRGAKLRGVDLRAASLLGANLSRADLRDAYLRGADLRRADLRYADLSGAELRGVVLTGADLCGTIGLPQAPVVPDLDRQMAEVTAPDGALDMREWHTCATTHCRAGWAVILAGPAGADLEKSVGTGVAGVLIYYKSTGRIPDFHASDAEARADIVECAALAAVGLETGGHGE